MTAFEKSLRTLNEETLRAGAEELLMLLAQAPGVRRGRGNPGGSGGQKRSGMAVFTSAGGVSPEKGGGAETEAAPAIDGPAPDEEASETMRARRIDLGTDTDSLAAEEAVRDGAALPAQGFPKVTGREDQEDRKPREGPEDKADRENPENETDREDPEKPEGRGDLRDRENREGREDRKNREERKEQEDRETLESREDQNDQKNRENRETLESREDQNNQKNREDRARTLRTQGGETVDRVEMRALERHLQSVSGQRRGSLRQSGEDGNSGVYAAAFRGPERHYEGAVGARGTEMRRISEFFRRDSRRYDTGFTRY